MNNSISMAAATQNDDDESNGNTFDVISTLIERSKALLGELEAFRDRLSMLRKEGTVEIATFRGTVQSELNMLERLSGQPENPSTLQVARSSNVPFLEQVWGVAKNSAELFGLQKRVYLDPDVEGKFHNMHLHQRNVGKRRRKKKDGSADSSVTIDAITDGGRVWKKVSLVSNTRLLFDLAKQGWESDGSESEDGATARSTQNDDDDRDVPLVKTAKQLLRASQLFRVRTKHPSVQLYLPRLRPDETMEVSRIVKQIEAYGIAVFCGKDVELPASFSQAQQTMARDPILDFSNTLNIDCTILLALVSDFSHVKVSKEPWFHEALQTQVEIEDNENLLPALLYPALGNRKLVCTKKAADRMREIVDTIGTPTEKARTATLMGDDPSQSQTELVDEFQRASIYPVPNDLALPIEVVDDGLDNDALDLPYALKRVSSHMSPLNKSVFLFGWNAKRTTITSNRVVVKKIENDLEKFENLDEDVWPLIWLCPTARSLVGKEKAFASVVHKPEKTMRLPDPLRREHARRHGLDVLTSREGHKVEDLRPNGYPCDEVILAKNASSRGMTDSYESDGSAVQRGGSELNLQQ